MSEQDYIDSISASVTHDLPKALNLAKEAVGIYPNSATLWCRLGDLIQLAGDENDSLQDAFDCYTQATQIDATCADAFIGIGYYHDVHSQDLIAAETAFLRALELEKNDQAILGLARVLAQKENGRQESLALLDNANNQTSDQIEELRQEITSGVWDSF